MRPAVQNVRRRLSGLTECSIPMVLARCWRCPAAEAGDIRSPWVLSRIRPCCRYLIASWIGRSTGTGSGIVAGLWPLPRIWRSS